MRCVIICCSCSRVDVRALAIFKNFSEGQNDAMPDNKRSDNWQKKDGYKKGNISQSLKSVP